MRLGRAGGRRGLGLRRWWSSRGVEGRFSVGVWEGGDEVYYEAGFIRSMLLAPVVASR